MIDLTPARVNALVDFTVAMLRDAWEGCDDGDVIQERAERLGLIRRTKFDPAKHKDPHGYAESGDEWFEIVPWLAVRRALTTKGDNL